jgi:hypothetical protein
MLSGYPMIGTRVGNGTDLVWKQNFKTAELHFSASKLATKAIGV